MFIFNYFILFSTDVVILSWHDHSFLSYTVLNFVNDDVSIVFKDNNLFRHPQLRSVFQWGRAKNMYNTDSNVTLRCDIIQYNISLWRRAYARNVNYTLLSVSAVHSLLHRRYRKIRGARALGEVVSAFPLCAWVRGCAVRQLNIFVFQFSVFEHCLNTTLRLLQYN